jgi:hypothetical protein
MLDVAPSWITASVAVSLQNLDFVMMHFLLGEAPFGETVWYFVTWINRVSQQQLDSPIATQIYQF